MADEQQEALQRAYLEKMFNAKPEPAATDPTRLQVTDLTTADGTDASDDSTGSTS